MSLMAMRPSVLSISSDELLLLLVSAIEALWGWCYWDDSLDYASSIASSIVRGTEDAYRLTLLYCISLSSRFFIFSYCFFSSR